KLFHGPDAAARARGKGARAPRNRRTQVRLHSSRAPSHGAEIRFEAPGRDILRWLRRASGCSAARRGGRAPVRHRTRTDRGADREGPKGGAPMTPLLVDSTLRVSAVICLAFVAVLILRRRSAAMRHWVLAAALICAILMPALQRTAPQWHPRWRPSAPVTAPLARVTTPASDTQQQPGARQST